MYLYAEPSTFRVVVLHCIALCFVDNALHAALGAMITSCAYVFDGCPAAKNRISRSDGCLLAAPQVKLSSASVRISALSATIAVDIVNFILSVQCKGLMFRISLKKPGNDSGECFQKWCQAMLA